MLKKIIALALLLSTLALASCQGTSEDTTVSDTTAADTTASDTTDATTEPAKVVYYVRTPAQPSEHDGIEYPSYEYETYEEACARANDKYLAATGYGVYDSEGKFLYSLHGEYVTNMMYHAKHVTDFAKKNKYTYGSAATNPAVTYNNYLASGGRRLSEKVVSCDRLVGWVLYQMGYTDQPTDYGMFVWANSSSSDHNLMIYLDGKGYERIDRTSEFKAGDIVFVRPTTSTGGEPYGAHVFICAGSSGSRKMYYRYDHGSVQRIRCTDNFASYAEKGHPTNESIYDLFCVYRPTGLTLSDISAEPAE